MLTLLKCDGRLECAVCTQRNIPYIRLNATKDQHKSRYVSLSNTNYQGPLLLTIYRDLKSLLVPVIHALSETRKSNTDTSEMGNILIDDSPKGLQLLDEMNAISHGEIENLGHDPFVPIGFMGCSLLPHFSSTKCSPRMDSTPSLERLCAATPESCPLYQPKEFMDDPAGVPTESSIIWSSNQPFPCLTDPNYYSWFDINHMLPSLCRANLPMGEILLTIFRQ